MTLTREDMGQILSATFDRRITVAKIQTEVAIFYGINPEYMRLPDGKGVREPRISHPRQVAMFFARQCTPMSTPEIGRRFGGRDHSTVIHALRAVEKRAARDPFVELELEVLRERLAG